VAEFFFKKPLYKQAANNCGNNCLQIAFLGWANFVLLSVLDKCSHYTAKQKNKEW